MYPVCHTDRPWGKRKKPQQKREEKKNRQAEVAELPCLATDKDPCAQHPQLGLGFLQDSFPHVLNCFEKCDPDSKVILINICKATQENSWTGGDSEAVLSERPSS